MLTSTDSTKGRFGPSESPDSGRRPGLRVELNRPAALVSVAAVDPFVFEGTSTGGFLISRTDTVGDVVVPSVLGGTANAGSDYASLTGSVTIPDGRGSAIITVVPLEDGLSEGSEAVPFEIVDSAAIETDLATSTITIRDLFTATGGETVPLEQTFQPHSLPGARHTIYLDVLGSNRSWQEWNNGDPVNTPALRHRR